MVTFVYADWAARYPELATYVNAQQAQLFFNEAQLYCDNTTSSPVADLTQLTMLLYMMTAHIAALNAALGSPSSPLVGRINSATQGSVSVQTQLDMPAGSAQWFAQTKYGIAYWQASAQFRRFTYVRGKSPYARMDPFSPWRNTR